MHGMHKEFPLSLPWLQAIILKYGGRCATMNALEFVNSPVLTFRPPRKRQKPIKAQKGGDSTSDFGVPSSATARKWVRH